MNLWAIRDEVIVKRGEFLQCLGALASLACSRETPPPAPPPPPPAAPPPPPTPVEVPRHYRHSAWLQADVAASDDEWKRRLARYHEAGISALLLQVFDGEQAYYGSQHLPVKADVLGRVIPLAKEVGLEVYAWMWTLPCSVPAVLGAHPEWYMVNHSGESTANKPPYLPSFKFLCPTRPEVREFLKRRVSELANYPVAGIHLDYVRFPDRMLPIGLREQYGVQGDEPTPEHDYCYCDVCRQRFQEGSGIDPKNFNEPDEQATWSDFRERQLTELVNDVVVPISSAKKLQLSAAVYPNWQDVRQKWENWKLDVATPLLYHTLYQEPLTWIGFQAEEAVSRLQPGATCQPGLLVSQLSPQDLVGAFRMALEGDARGVSLFTAEAMSEDHWQLFERAQNEAEEQFRKSG